MTAENSSPRSRHQIIITACLVCSVVAVSMSVWLKASSQSIADTLRPVRIEEQRLGNRHARLSNPDNLERLAHLGGTLEDVQLNLVEVIERSRNAVEIHALQIDIEDGDPGSSLDLKGAAATQLRLSIDSTLLHEGALLDLLATLKSAVGAWPMRVQSCDVARVQARVQARASRSDSQPIRARCTVSIVHWFWPKAQTTARLPVVSPTPWGRELQGQRLFNTEEERNALDLRADVANQGVLALAWAALEKADGASAAATRTETTKASLSKVPVGSASLENDSSIIGTKQTSVANRRIPSIVFGGVIRGISTSVVMLNGVPCPVMKRGRISESCGQGRLATSAASRYSDRVIKKVWLEYRALESGRRPQLHVVYADGRETSLSAGEQSY